MKTTKKDALNVIDVLIEQITQKQSDLEKAKNYGVDNHRSFGEITNAVTEISVAAKALQVYAEMISVADFSETEVG